MNYFHDKVDNIHQKRIWRPWNQCGSIFLTYATSHLKFFASRHRDTRELPLEQRPNLHQAGDPIEKHTDLLKHGYIIVVFSLERTVSSEIQLLNTTSLSPRDADDVGLAQFDFTRPVSRETGTRIFATGGGGDCDTCHQDNVMTCQQRLRLLSIQTLNCFNEQNIGCCGKNGGIML